MKQLSDTGCSASCSRRTSREEAHLCEFLESVMAVGSHSRRRGGSAAWSASTMGAGGDGPAAARRSGAEPRHARGVTLRAVRPGKGGRRCVVFSAVGPTRRHRPLRVIILGGLLTTLRAMSERPGDAPLRLPRSDYEIVADSCTSWACRNGEPDVIVDEAFIPIIESCIPGPRRWQYRPGDGPNGPLYAIPSASCSRAPSRGDSRYRRGALKAFTDYTRDRVRVNGVKVAGDPFQLAASRGHGDLDASRRHVLSDIERLYDIWRPATTSRSTNASWCAPTGAGVTAGCRCGRPALRSRRGRIASPRHPLQAFWRDLHAA